MISKDKKLEDEYNVQLLEYLASFWNPEAVSKIRQHRELHDDTRFMDDQKFEESVAKEMWKDESIINTIKNKYKNTNLDDIIEAQLEKNFSKSIQNTAATLS